MRFTDISIRKLKPTDSQSVAYDDALPNFGIRYGKRTKTFFVKLGKSRSIKSIGRYPDLSLSDARREAKRLLSSDVSSRAPKSLKVAVALFSQDAKDRLSPKTLKEYKRYLDAFDTNKKVNDITRQDVHTELSKYRDKPSSHQHAVVTFKVFFNWCLRMDMVDKNPAIGERTPKITPRDRVLTPDELKQVYNYDHKPFSTILKLCILTGQRRSEIAKIHSDWIEGGVLTIPATVAKNRKVHTIPLTPLAQELLQGEGQIFGNDVGTTFCGWSKAKTRLDKDLQIPHWTIHDLRRCFATLHAELGTPVHLVERMLNHTAGTISGVAAIYIRHSFIDEMREAQQRYEKVLMNIVQS